MNALIVLLYLALCVLLFQICRVPLNRWTAPAAALGGVMLIGGSIVTLDRYHPYSDAVQPQTSVIPIAAPVAGTVAEVAVDEGQTVRRGELLFRVDPEPLEFEVRALEARVAQAEASLKQSDAGAARELAQAELAVTRTLLSQALYRLAQTYVRAPADGRVTGLDIAPGQTLAAQSAQPAMRLVAIDPATVVALMTPDRIALVEPGTAAEIAFDAIPGRVFTAEVTRVAPATDGSTRTPLQIRITDPAFDAGAMTGAAQAVIYGKQLPEIAILRKVLLRMAAWIDFVHPYA